MLFMLQQLSEKVNDIKPIVFTEGTGITKERLA
jgi:hypothetical protein